MPRFQRIRRSAPVRIVLEGAAIIFTVAVPSRMLSALIPAEPSPWHAGLAVLRNLILAGLLIAVYRWMVLRLERRRAIELSTVGIVQFPAGAVLGVAIMALVYGILWAAHLATLGPGTGLPGIGAGLIAMFLAAVVEELLFRGILFRIVEQACGTAVALIGSAALFGLMHGMNPGATLFSDVAIAVEAGLLLGCAYALTRSLWLPIGIHTGWNFAEGNLFGALVSGTRPSHSLIHSDLSGPVLLTGGDFGPEASVVSILVCTFIALLFGIRIARHGGWQPRCLRLA